MDVRKVLRSGGGLAEVAAILGKAVLAKPTGHRLEERVSTEERACSRLAADVRFLGASPAEDSYRIEGFHGAARAVYRCSTWWPQAPGPSNHTAPSA